MIKNLKKLIGVAVVITATVLTSNAQQVGYRLNQIENPPTLTYPSNSTSVPISFGGVPNLNTNAPVLDYYINQLSGALTLRLTNLVAGRTARIFISTDGTGRAITVSTNGMPSLEVVWAPADATNGSATCTFTNRGRITLTCQGTNKVWGSIFRGL